MTWSAHTLRICVCSACAGVSMVALPWAIKRPLLLVEVSELRSPVPPVDARCAQPAASRMQVINANDFFITLVIFCYPSSVFPILHTCGDEAPIGVYAVV